MNTTHYLVAALCLLAVPLAAQQPGGMMHERRMQGMGMMGMDSMMAPMMRTMATAPQHLLAAKERLHLSADQETRLVAIRDAAKSAHDAAAQQAMMHLGEMADVMRAAAPDTGAVRHHFDAGVRFMSQAHWAMLSAAAQARAVLNDDQRKQVDAMADSMMTRRHEN
jgi:hypothetical protein